MDVPATGASLSLICLRRHLMIDYLAAKSTRGQHDTWDRYKKYVFSHDKRVVHLCIIRGIAWVLDCPQITLQLAIFRVAWAFRFQESSLRFDWCILHAIVLNRSCSDGSSGRVRWCSGFFRVMLVSGGQRWCLFTLPWGYRFRRLFTHCEFVAWGWYERNTDTESPLRFY